MQVITIMQYAFSIYTFWRPMGCVWVQEKQTRFLWRYAINV